MFVQNYKLDRIQVARRAAARSRLGCSSILRRFATQMLSDGLHISDFPPIVMKTKLVSPSSRNKSSPCTTQICNIEGLGSLEGWGHWDFNRNIQHCITGALNVGTFCFGDVSETSLAFIYHRGLLD